MRLKFTLLLLLLPSLAIAAPAPSGTTGTVGHGEDLIIAGSGFGTKTAAAPFRWDDFQGGTPGARVTPSDTVFDLQGIVPRRPWFSGAIGYCSRGDTNIVGMTRYDGDITCLQYFYNASDEMIGAGTNRAVGVIDQPSTVWYVSFWAYQEDYAGTALNCDNVKIYGNFASFNWDNSGGTTWPRYDIRWGEAWNSGSGFLAAIGCNGGAGDLIYQHGGTYRNNLGRWIRVEQLLDMGDTEVSNGLHAGYRDLELISQFSGVMTPSHCDGENAIGSYKMGTNFFSTNGATLRHYISELYVDHSFARVEIGNASTWGACTHREIQIPSAWSATSITVTQNLAGFPAGAPKYLYVVDEDRAVNTAGLLLGEGGEQVFGAPTPGAVSGGVIASLTYPAYTGAAHYYAWVIEAGGQVPRRAGHTVGTVIPDIPTSTLTGTVYVTAHAANDSLLATSQAAAYGGN